MVSFDQRDAGRAADPGNDRGILPRRQVDHQSRLCIVPRSKTSRLDGILLRVFPIVVSRNLIASAITQIEHRISQRPGYAERRQGWAKRTHHYPLRRLSVNDESGDCHILRDADSGPGGNVGHPHMRHYLDDDGVVCDCVDIVGNADHKVITARSAETRVRSGGLRIS